MSAKEIAGKKEYAVSADVLGMFEADAGAGLDLQEEDLALPFLKVLSRQDTLLDELENAKAGDLYNTVSGEVYSGKEGLLVIPCHYERKYLEWLPRGSGSGSPQNIYSVGDQLPETDRSPDDNKEYVRGGDGSYLEETAQHYVIVINEDGSLTTALVSMKSTQLKKSRKWNSMVASRTMIGANGLPFQPPRYSHVYRLKTSIEENSKGSWFGWEITLEKPISDAGMFTTAKQFAESISKGEVKVKHVSDDAPNQSSIKVEDDDLPF